MEKRSLKGGPMKKKTLHKIGGYGLLALAFALLVGPTLIIAGLRKPQMVALQAIEEQPVALSASAK